MCPRKFRLVARKNAERKRYHSFSITIPKTKLPVKHLASLKSQLSPIIESSPWTLTASTDEGKSQRIILCLHEADRESPVLRFSLIIRDDFTWVLSFTGQVIDSQSCRALSNAPRLLDCADTVVQFLSLVQHCKVCEGNMDEKFMEVAKRRDGIFKDHSGKEYYSQPIRFCLLIVAIISNNRFSDCCTHWFESISF